MKEKQMKDALESIARRAIPDDVNLMPAITARLERKSFMTTLRTKPVLMTLLVLLALAVLTGVAYAVGKATGYIPGIGLVDQSEQLRVLAEPVSVRREGIALTVEQVVLSADKTVVIYKVEGIPAEAWASDNGEAENSVSSSVIVPLDGTPVDAIPTVEMNGICFDDENLSLPDGKILPLQTGEGSGWSSGFENRHVFGPVPMEINEATFMMSCVPGTAAGKLPENWEVPLQFVPAQPDMTVLPVVDMQTSTTDESQPAMILEQVIETDDGYILIGKFRSIGLPEHAKANGISRWIKITDADGHEIEALNFNNLEPSNTFGEFTWGYEIKGKHYAWPLTLTIDDVNALFYRQITEFEFDTGLNPQVGQKWFLNKDVRFEGYAIRVLSVERTNKGYSFIFKADPNVIGITAEIKDFPYSNSYGGNDGFGKGDLYFGGGFEGEPPSGKLTVELGWLHASIHGPWQVQWSAENLLPTP